MVQNLQMWKIGLIWVKIKENRSCTPEAFFGKNTLKIRSKFTGEHSFQSAISIKLLCNFIEITPRHGCSPGNLLHIFRTPFYKNIYGGRGGGLLLGKLISSFFVTPQKHFMKAMLVSIQSFDALQSVKKLKIKL